jgi:protein-S-isoprenylcysteine O-methyltransferase Ste14
MKRIAPLSIYYCLQSQIAIWLISIFGTTHQVADVGAVVRLGMIFALLTPVYITVAVPRFARNNGRAKLRRQFWFIVGSFAVLLTGLVFFTWIFPEPLLWLLGPKYQHLSNLVWLAALSVGMSSFLSLVNNLNSSKGWVPPATVTIPIEVSTQILLLATLNLSRSADVLAFSCFSALPPLLMYAVISVRGIAREEP